MMVMVYSGGWGVRIAGWKTAWDTKQDTVSEKKQTHQSIDSTNIASSASPHNRKEKKLGGNITAWVAPQFHQFQRPVVSWKVT